MHKCFWNCWPSRRDLDDPALYFQTWVTNHSESHFCDEQQVVEAAGDVERSADEDHSASIVPPHEEPQGLDSLTATNSTDTQVTMQNSIQSSIDLDSDDDALTLVVQTSDGASLHDCVRSSSDESPVRSPQDTANSEGPGRSRTKVKGLDAESRDVLRALPLDSELRFAGMVAAAQQAAAAALSQPSPRGDAADCGKTPRNMPTPRNLSTPRTARTPRSGRPSSKRDRQVTSSKKKKGQQKEQSQAATVQV